MQEMKCSNVSHYSHIAFCPCNIAECIAESPLIDICGIERSSVAENVTKFMDIASEMMRNLGMPEFESMNAAERCVCFYCNGVFSCVQ